MTYKEFFLNQIYKKLTVKSKFPSYSCFLFHFHFTEAITVKFQAETFYAYMSIMYKFYVERKHYSYPFLYIA